MPICNVCNSPHCREANMDETDGCCICYNKQMVREDKGVISLCDECKEHSK